MTNTIVRPNSGGETCQLAIVFVAFETLRDWECFDGDTGKDSAREIREYFIPDFSNWKDIVATFKNTVSLSTKPTL